MSNYFGKLCPGIVDPNTGVVPLTVGDGTAVGVVPLTVGECTVPSTVDEATGTAWSIQRFSYVPHPGDDLGVLVKKVNPEAKLPERAHLDDLGYDLFVASLEPKSGGVLCVHTGIAMQPPPGWGFEMVPRSSLHKKGWLLANSVGVIDSGYRGEVMVMLAPWNQAPERPAVGDRIVQIIPRKIVNVSFYEVAELGDTARGAGGFGSSGA